MAELTMKMEDSVDRLKAQGETAARLRSKYRREHAKAVLASRTALGKSSEKERDAYAVGRASDIQVHDEETGEMFDLLTAMEIADARFAAARDVLHLQRSEGEMLRTMLVQTRGVQDPRPQSTRP